MLICGFCTNKTEDCRKISDISLENDGKYVKALDYLSIFKSELTKFVYSDTHFDKDCINICGPCLQHLQNAYLFIQQMQNAQRKLTAQMDTAKLRKILPKSTDDKCCYIAPTSKAPVTKRVYKCSDCSETFIAFRQLKAHEIETHLTTAPSSEITSICEYCCSLYANAETLEKHQSTVHADERYSCALCGANKSYKQKGHLLKHMAKMHQAKSLRYFCTLCPPASADPVEFDSRTALQQHFQAVHLLMPERQAGTDDDEDVEIEMNEEFLDEFLLSNNNENSFQFSECWDALDLHLPDMLQLPPGSVDNTLSAADTDSTVAAFKCPKCFEDCADQKCFLLHLAHKHGMRVLLCNRCDEGFSSTLQLSRHKAIEHSSISSDQRQQRSQHSCPFCSKIFIGGGNLKQHLRIVHSQLKPHICQLCDKQFATLDHLRKHVLSVHQNDRKHICHVCSKRFTQLCHLKQHLAIHTHGKTLQCTKCESTFWRKIDLARHMLNKHEF